VPVQVVISDSSCLIDLRKTSLLAALQALASDPTVRLPPQELAAFLKRYGGA